LSEWPDKGEIEVTQLQAQYAPDLPNILHDISFMVKGGQRVGLVGATGGGKSTLAKAFFSFVDISHGTIKIDGKGKSHWIGHALADATQISHSSPWVQSALS